VPMISRDDIHTVAHSMAQGENNDMLQGQTVTPAVDDPHKLHADMHLRSASDLLQKAMGGEVEPEQALTAFNLHVQHIAQHVAQMGLDETRTEQVKQYTQGVRQLVAASKELEQIVKQRQAEREAQQAEQQQKLADSEGKDVELDARKYKIDQEMELSRQEAVSKAQDRELKTVAKLQQDQEKNTAQIQMLMEKHNASKGSSE